MKLKLETSAPAATNSSTGASFPSPNSGPPEGITLLVVTEGIESSSLAILKAGLNKLVASGRRNILLDCTDLKESDIQDATLFAQISDLRGWAASLEGGAQVLVVSSIERMGHVRTREEGITLLNSGTAHLLALEAKLQNDIKVLQARKAELEAKLTQASAAGDPKALLKQNSDLKRSIADTDRLTRRFLKNRSPHSSNAPFQVPATELLQENLDQLLNAALKKEGILL
jgi:hypothetical protein